MTKKSTAERAALTCVRALERVDEAIANHGANSPEDLSVKVLRRVKDELEQMVTVLDSTKYKPSYGKFILDWPDEHGLIDVLLGASQDYQRWT